MMNMYYSMSMYLSITLPMPILLRFLAVLVLSLSFGLSAPLVNDAEAQGFFERLFGKKKRVEPRPSQGNLRRARPRAPRSFKPIVPHILLAGGKSFPITVIGDSQAAALFQGMARQLREHQNVVLTRTVRGNAGLVRTDRYDLAADIKLKLAKLAPRIAVIMIGINDRQRFPPQAIKGSKPSKPPVFSSAVWQKTYSGRIDGLLNTLRNRNVAIYWVGLPIVRDRAHAQDNAYLNDVIRERVQRAGGKFIDIWEAFASETGAYTRLGPDLKGGNRRLRTKDGIHFTSSGAQKLAHFAVKEILADFGTSTLQRPDGRGLNAGIVNRDAQAGLVVRPLSTSGIQGYASAAVQPLGRSFAPRRAAPVQAPSYVRALEWGDALPALKGRADDFSWPRR